MQFHGGRIIMLTSRPFKEMFFYCSNCRLKSCDRQMAFCKKICAHCC